MFSCQPIPPQNRDCDALFSNTHFATTGTELINGRIEVTMKFNQLREDVNVTKFWKINLMGAFCTLNT